MKIDPKAELLGRETVSACIARDLERVIRAIEAIEQVPLDTQAQVLQIYAGVGTATLLSIYKGGVPNHDQNRDLARRVVASETWTNLTVDQTCEVLESLSIHHSPAVPVGEAVATLFVTIGYLLAIYSRPLGYATSYEFLDALLDEIEKV